MMELVRGSATKSELLALLAEEAAELSQAALKLRRAEGSGVVTPVSVLDAETHLAEEIADVWLLLRVLEIDGPAAAYEGRMDAKLKRWVDRLRNAEKEVNNGQVGTPKL